MRKPALADGEDGLLGVVDDLLDHRLRLICQSGDLVSGFQQPAPGAGVLDQVAIGLGVQRGRDTVQQTGQVGRAADLVQAPLPLELFGDRQQIDRQPLVVKAGEGLVDPTIAMEVEIFRRQELGDVVVGLRIDQHRPQDGLFSLAAVGDTLG